MKSVAKLLLFTLVLSVLVFSATAEMSQEEIDWEFERESMSYLVLYMNEEKTLNLSEYAYDPDGDEITFTPSRMAQIATSIEGEELTLTPKPGYSGKEVFSLTAEDTAGNEVHSPFIQISVLDLERPTFWGTVSDTLKSAGGAVVGAVGTVLSELGELASIIATALYAFVVDWWWLILLLLLLLFILWLLRKWYRKMTGRRFLLKKKE